MEIVFKILWTDFAINHLKDIFDYHLVKASSTIAQRLVQKIIVATSRFTEPIQFIINASEVLGSSKKKQEVDFDLLCRLVPGAGLEPAQP